MGQESPNTQGEGRAFWRRLIGRKRIALLFLYLLAGVLAWKGWAAGLLTPQMVMEYIAANPVSAPLVFITVYAVIVVFMIPSLPLNVGAGYLWGPLLGSVYTTIGCVIGSVVAFHFARTAFGQPFSRQFDSNLLQWLSRQTSENGWKVVAFIRLNPAFPNGAVNYLLGLTSLSAFQFTWATVVFLFPLSYGFAYLGNTAASLVLDGEIQRIAHLLVAGSFMLCVLVAGRITYRHCFGKTL